MLTQMVGRGAKRRSDGFQVTLIKSFDQKLVHEPGMGSRSDRQLLAAELGKGCLYATTVGR